MIRPTESQPGGAQPEARRGSGVPIPTKDKGGPGVPILRNRVRGVTCGIIFRLIMRFGVFFIRDFYHCLFWNFSELHLGIRYRGIGY